MDDLNKIKKALELKLDELANRVDSIEDDLREPHNDDWSEDASESQRDETLEEIESISLEEIIKIKSALSKIEDGTYGNCDECGNKISVKRLEALPYAVKCVDCKES